ncbi:hypothetical protein SAMN06295905_0621 [Devosia lucknowensis]|uniref:DUF2188 domain-containing protein n=1 Tax=Devosia lucknowensis TaxID=1096929 RepID=A0A1Y6ELN0_9HYPH|nr:DUF2188 domain-containing protein [Devosia lucknowensis]SMQ62121.1 hypothetical protein SAMN06295905_0621 [Devosia lucknowensis]
MSESHFLVYLRNGSWQHSNRGTTSAPFSSRETAIEAAIEEARQSGDASAEVIVQDSETSTETVWRSGSDKA